MKVSSAFLTILFCSTAIFSTAQDLDKATVKNLVDSGNFVFVAQSMVPSGGTSRPLDFFYDVRVSKDSIITHLPYIVRAYTGVLPNEDGINFTSAIFDYKTKYKKKKWEITLRPKDTKDVKELHFTVFENGKATLTVNPINKKTASYYGYLKTN